MLKELRKCIFLKLGLCDFTSSKVGRSPGSEVVVLEVWVKPR